MSGTKNIFAISGSLREGSSNHAILLYLKELFPGNINFIIYDELSKVPPFDPGLDQELVPAPVSSFRELIKQADAIVICSPEYAYGVPGQLKNALDWTVSRGSFVDKPLALITASTGGESAHAAMLLILGALSANVLKDAVLLISFVKSKIDHDGNVTDAMTIAGLKKLVDTLLRAI